jgi:C-methyltransferase
MSTPPVTPEPIMNVCTGLWAAGVLKGAIELQVFDPLTTGPQDAEALSQGLHVPPAGLQILLDALVALGLLATGPQGYRLLPVAAEFLVSSKPTYLGPFAAEILGDPTLYDLYRQYRRVVSEGYQRDPWAYCTGANVLVGRLVRQLFTLGYPVAEAIAEHQGWTADHPAALRLLAVGCGSAVYGLVALTRLRQAQLTAQDWPPMLSAPQEFAAQLGVADRVQT